MTERHDHGYYRRREKAERELAAKAADPQIARIHLDLAERYAMRADNSSVRPTLRVAI